MAAAIHNEVADKGATYTLSVQYVDDTDQPIDLSGHTARFVMTTRAGNPLTLFTQDAVTTADGWIHVVVPDETTATWRSGMHAYRVELDNAGTLVFTVVGSFKVRSAADV